MQVYDWSSLIEIHSLVFTCLFVFFLVATFFQTAVYGLIFKTGWTKLLRRGEEIPADLPPVSVVICARNEAANLKKNLPLILQQRYPAPWELIVIDDASEDETPDVLDSLSNNYPHFRHARIFPKISPGKKAALRYGIETARFDHCILTDADCTPSGAEWLQHMAAALVGSPETEIVLGLAPLHCGHTGIERWAAFEAAQTAFLYAGAAAAGMPYMGVGRNLGWKKAVFMRAGGFERHADLSSGDDDLLVNAQARARNTTVCIHPGALMFSEAPLRFSTWLRQRRRHLSASGHYKTWHKLALGALAGAQVFHYFFGFILCVFGWRPLIVLSVSALRWLLLARFYQPAFQRMQTNLSKWELPLFDFLQACYHGLTVPYNLLFRRGPAQWK